MLNQHRKRKPVRRLTNIRTDEVSLVDKAANLKTFVLIKNKGEINMEEVTRILQEIEKVLTANNKIATDNSEAIKELQGLFEEPTKDELKKAGAKFSKGNLAMLKSIKDMIGKLLVDQADDDEDGKDTKDKKDMTDEEIMETVKNIMDETLGVNKPKEDDTTKQVATIVEAVMKAMKEVEKTE